MLSCGSQSMEVRLLSSSEVISHRSKGEEEMETLSAVAFGESPGSLDGCCAAALAQV